MKVALSVCICGWAVFGLAFLSPVLEPGRMGIAIASAHAESASSAEKDAFEAAKELGTADAWNAFLANYSTGFHADLARAYLKKLGETPQAGQPPATGAVQSQFDDFPVVAGSWGGIVRAAPSQDARKVDSLDEGDEVTLMARTEVVENGFPWFKIAYAKDGKGYQWGGILCAVGQERPDVYKTCPVKSQAKKDDDEPAKRKQATKRCASGRVLIDGRCVEKAATASFCGPGYRPQGGKCVKGYQAPSANAPLSTEAVNKGCPKGQVWNAAEGCHEDD